MVEQNLNIGGLGLKKEGLKVRKGIASGSGRTVPEHGGHSLKEDSLMVRTIIASASGRTVPGHGSQPQGGWSEGKNKH